MIRIKKILSLFFVALFVSYYASTTLFSHLHHISGATIYHSHFHTESHHDTKTGGHIEQSLTLIAQISNFDYIDFSCDCIQKPLEIPIYENKYVSTTHYVTSIHLENTSLRAPPVV
jgi:hypothetical protein